MGKHRWTARAGLLAALLLFCGTMGRLVAHTSVMTNSNTLEVGAKAPAFHLRTTAGKTIDSESLRGKVVVVGYTSQRCPISKEYLPRFREVANAYRADDRVVFLEVNADVASGQLSAAELSDQVRRQGVNHPVLIDSAGAFAHSYGAGVTPTFYIIGRNGALRYCGAFDAGREATKEVSKQYVEEGVRRVLEGLPLTYTSTEAIGCRVPRVEEGKRFAIRLGK